MTPDRAALERLAACRGFRSRSPPRPSTICRACAPRSARGPRLLVKRDDAIPFGFGGNKIRKLQLVAAQALAEGADTLITCGGIQSNHARATASVAARLGLGCVLVANGAPPDEADRRTRSSIACSAPRSATSASREARAPAMEAAAAELRAQGPPSVRHSARRVHASRRRRLRAGGDGAAGADRRRPIDRPVDLLRRHAGRPHRRLPAARAVDPRRSGSAPTIRRRRSPTRSAGSWAGSRSCSAVDAGTLTDAPIEIDDRFVGGGYGVPTPQSTEAIELCARREALFLDPTYTAKAMAGLIAKARAGELGSGTTLFWHTGGQVGLFA